MATKAGRLFLSVITREFAQRASERVARAYTVKPLKTDTPRDEQKCPSYRGVRLIEVIFSRNLPLGHVEVSVLGRCPSYGMSVLRGFTVIF